MKLKQDIGLISSKLMIGFYLLVAFLGSFLAGDIPIYCNKNGKVTFPVLSELLYSSSFNTQYDSESCIMPFIPFSPLHIDKRSPTAISPFDTNNSGSIKNRHWLGTDKLGRDVASGMIHGTAVALKIGLLSIIFAFIFGVGLGMLSAYYKDDGIRFNLLQGLIFIFLSGAGIYYLSMEYLLFNPSFLYFIMGTVFLIIILWKMLSWLSKLKNLKKYNFPLDMMLLKIIEIRKSFPGVFILLALTCLFAAPSIWNIVFIIALLSWTEFARFARAETLAIKEENYILSVKVLGYDDFKILTSHILPNILPTLLVVACFNTGGAVLLESTLSFLGIGLPVEQVSWGKMMGKI